MSFISFFSYLSMFHSLETPLLWKIHQMVYYFPIEYNNVSEPKNKSGTLTPMDKTHSTFKYSQEPDNVKRA